MYYFNYYKRHINEKERIPISKTGITFDFYPSVNTVNK
jgi:hypothetical protein